MATESNCWAIVPAAGSGSRMGGTVPKQFLELGDRRVLEHSLEALWSLSELAGVVLVSDDEAAVSRFATRARHGQLLTAPGGRQRCHSVLNGLAVLLRHAQPDDWVLVHDAARPCVRAGDLRKLVSAVTSGGDGGLLGVPVCDTIKRCDASARVTGTLDRNALWHAQTPQMFRVGQLQSAMQAALDEGYEVTDEASAMEHAGFQPQLVQGHADNIKITRREDLPVAALYLEKQGRL